MLAMMPRNVEPMLGDFAYPAILFVLLVVPYLARRAGDAWDRWTRTPMTTPAARRRRPPTGGPR